MRVNDAKILLRSQIEALRTEISAENHRTASHAICEQVIRLLQQIMPLHGRKRSVLLTYMPFRAEIDITPITEWAWSQGIHVLMPRVERDKRAMAMCEVTSWEELAIGSYGIREPAEDALIWDGNERIDVAIIPGVAFDRDGRRLGYGGGYYDRWLGKMRSVHGPGEMPYLLAPAFQLQIVEHVPSEPHDVQMNKIVTELDTYPH